MRGIAGSIILMPVLMTGCASFTPRQVAQPGDVTVMNALVQVDEGLAYLQEQASQRKVGLAVDEVTVIFDISAVATAKNGGKLTLADVPIGPVGVLRGEASTELTNYGKRGNQITIKFKNLATADLSKGVFANDTAAKKRIGSKFEDNITVRNLPKRGQPR